MKPWAAWAVVPGLAVGMLSVAGAQMPRQPAPPAPAVPALGVFEGVSTSGSLQEALDDAVSRAVRREGTESRIAYQVLEIGGERASGGLDLLRVRIQVTERPERRTPIAGR